MIDKPYFFYRFLLLRDIRCWKCDKETGKIIFCNNCDIIQKPDENICPFERLKIKKTFTVDEKDIKTKLRELQSKVHPDKFSNKSVKEKSFSDKHSSLLNEAYKVVMDPLLRAEYLLEESKTKEDDLMEDNELLMEMMELNEEISNISNNDSLNQKKDDMEKERNNIIRNLDDAFKNNDIDEAKKLVTRLKYITSARKHILKRLGLD
uniref:J domain-containing protein n=1 Tax=Parastrongyloides trichosuri TaxID=131310 RepID=A0A0N4ZQX2_PARTI